MRFGLSTGSFLLSPLSQSFAMARAAGFEGLELMVGPQVALGGARRVKALSRAWNVPVLSVHQPLFPIPGWMRLRQQLKRCGELAHSVGADVATLHAAQWLVAGGPWSEAAAQLVRETRSVSLENIPVVAPARLQPAAAAGYLTAFETFVAVHDLRVTLDVAHAAEGGLDVLSAYEALKQRLANVHLSDVARNRFCPPSHLMLSLLVHHRLPERGQLPLRELLRRLAADDYMGLVTFEISPTAMSFWSFRRMAAELRDALDFCRSASSARA
jgi:sugar phosphate isomerase/epimerase